MEQAHLPRDKVGEVNTAFRQLIDAPTQLREMQRTADEQA